MNTNRKTIKMPVRYLMNAVLVGLLFVGLSFLTQNPLSTYQNKVLLTVRHQHHSGCLAERCHRLSGAAAAGHAGFMAVGASPAPCSPNIPTCPPVSLAIGLVLACQVMAGPVPVLIGIPALRLTGDYLAILTLGLWRDRPHHPEQHR